jgi:putative nucleotidyltransferase with HDIG domain
VNTNVIRLILATVAAAVLVIAAATLLFPIRPEIGGVPGLIFWTLATLVASALPVRLPRGSVVSVGSAPILASMILGGPAAAAIVSFIGTTDEREVRGQVPWYGTLYNHSAAAASVAVAGMLYEILLATLGRSNPVLEFAFALAASAIFLALTWVLAVLAVTARTGVPTRTIWAQDVGGVAANLIGLAPLAWLMALVFQLPNGVGWWATPLFVVPLFTTRLAYARYVETRELFEQTIEALSKAVDARDPYTRNHSSRVSHIAEAMCRVIGLGENEIEKIKWAGLLHDIGKIGIPDVVLRKPSKLTAEEYGMFQQHVALGGAIVRDVPHADIVRAGILHHHERWDGNGYLAGLAGDEIPVIGRVLAVADAFSAMTTTRPYRKALPVAEALKRLGDAAGTQLEESLVAEFISGIETAPDAPLPGEEPIQIWRPELWVA